MGAYNHVADYPSAWPILRRDYSCPPHRSEQACIIARLYQSYRYYPASGSSAAANLRKGMRIAIVGAGGVGGYFGAKLAVSGEEVHFIARGAHLDAIKRDGLRVLSANGDVLVKPALATNETASVGPVDLVIIAVKLWSTEDAVRDAKPLIGPATALLSFQNGVFAADVIAQTYGKEHTLGGVANIAALIEKPGVIRHNGTMALLTVGELDGRRSARVEQFLHTCAKANIQARAATTS
ncbi:MAG: 2-dehydropantoate 2-reductase N-terminal domain-containing protein [Gammaproteobacteria bacterium]